MYHVYNLGRRYRTIVGYLYSILRGRFDQAFAISSPFLKINLTITLSCLLLLRPLSLGAVLRNVILQSPPMISHVNEYDG